jgi:ATP-binding cassette subfamily F protein uup
VVREYVGGYQDWLRQGGSVKLLGVGEAKESKAQATAQAAAAAAVAPAAEAAAPKKKLSYKLQRELEALPGRIDEVEQAIAALQAEIGAPAFYQQSAEVTAATMARLEALQAELDQLVERWAELEA